MISFPARPIGWTTSAFLLAAFVIPATQAQTTVADHNLTWVQRHTPVSPDFRESPAMAYDPLRKQIILFGGFNNSGYFGDTWAFNGATWKKLPDVGPLGPDGRAASTIIFDQAARQLILFGGYNGSYLNDTWILDEKTSTWTRARPAQSPTPVTGPMSFQDPVNGHAEVFGGFDGRFYQASTWQWTGSTWTLLQPATSPLARGFGIAANDPVHKNVVQFGGLADINPNNTWLWDGTSWTEATPLRQPLIHYGGGAAFEPHLKNVIAFGGGNGGPQLPDTWKWTGKTWVHMAPAQSPWPRESFGMAYDDAIGKIVIFGGLYNNLYLNDTWVAVPQP